MNDQSLSLSVIESFYVGGEHRDIIAPNVGPDRLTIGAMYVQHMAPSHQQFPLPVVLIHGALHTGVTWETTPDGREGWQTLFVRGGFDTYVIDQPYRGRSVPDLSGMMPGLLPPTPLDVTYVRGAKVASYFARGGVRFSSASLNQYASQLCPDFSIAKAEQQGRPGLSDPRALPPLLDLLDRLGEAVLVTHSQGSHLGWVATLARPQRVAAIVAIEPVITTPELDNPGFPDIPVCLMWGDNIPEEAAVLNMKDISDGRRLAAQRDKIELDWLPEQGIAGNGHMLMMEDNSAQIANRVMNWFCRVYNPASS
jgi:pimeloyl-ACP methyl ester carboxylesterase